MKYNNDLEPYAGEGFLAFDPSIIKMKTRIAKKAQWPGTAADRLITCYTQQSSQKQTFDHIENEKNVSEVKKKTKTFPQVQHIYIACNSTGINTSL